MGQPEWAYIKGFAEFAYCPLILHRGLHRAETTYRKPVWYDTDLFYLFPPTQPPHHDAAAAPSGPVYPLSERRIPERLF